MSRKTREVAISSGTKETNRDFGKKFLLTEMDAGRSERWAMRALKSLLRANPSLPDEIANGGMAGIAVAGFQALAGMEDDVVDFLMDELMSCVQRIEPALTRKLLEEDIEEVGTRLHLKMEVFSLHVGFSLADTLSKRMSAMKAKLQDSSGTQTSGAA